MLPSALKNKIWGSLTVHDIALNKQEFPSLKKDTGCPGYRVPNPSLRYNFGSRPFKLSGARNKNFLDTMIQVKKIIPGPGAYVRPDNWAKMDKPIQIYTRNRSSFMDHIIKTGKATPGIGKYDNQKWDKIYNKRSKGKISANETNSFIEEVMEKSSQLPGFY